jgi:gamma-glutamylcysteine synthetase
VVTEEYALQEAIDQLAARFAAAFPARVAKPRIVGREAEYPVVTAEGQSADVRRLWAPLLEQGDLHPKYDSGNPNLMVALEGSEYSYTIEVGVGTIEVNTPPCADLFQIEAVMEAAVSPIVRAAARQSWQMLGYGIQPLTPPALGLMTPKQRYQSLYRAMGEAWLWYTVTASDQIQVDIERDELVLMLNCGNLMAPVLIALCANSPIFAGQASPFCSAREGRMAQILAGEHRHGMPLAPYRSLADYVERLTHDRYLVIRGDQEIMPSSQRFSDYLLEHGPDFEAFLFHEHYVWNSARLRVAYGTVEIRPACQQPWGEHMAAMAMGLGLVEAAAPILEYVQTELGDDYWETMRAYHRNVIARGLDAPQPAPGFLAQIVELAYAGIAGRGLGEESFLEPIWRRLERRENPAQRARRIFASDGMHGLIAHTAIRPGLTRRAAF